MHALQETQRTQEESASDAVARAHSVVNDERMRRLAAEEALRLYKHTAREVAAPAEMNSNWEREKEELLARLTVANEEV